MHSSALSNPFYQPARQWQIRVYMQQECVGAIEEAFGDGALAVSSFELDEAAGKWCVDILTDVPVEKQETETRLALVSGLLGITTPDYEVEMIASRNWVMEVEKKFPPFFVGRFFVHGARMELAPGAKGLLVTAGAAFGSGEHATTRGCLLALDQLAKRRRFQRPLDMGCGSGILAIAMAKLWRVPVTGIDVDPVSIEVAKANARRNQVSENTYFAAGDGYCCNTIRKRAPFDVIVANILARPLVKMAPALAYNLKPGGVAVLSGLLASQERMVLVAHRAQGLRLVSRICCEGWNTLVVSF